jgi:hypothetical protein
MLRPKRKSAEMADTKIKCLLKWEQCSEKSEMWREVETRFNEEYEGRVASDDDLEENCDFDCEIDSADDDQSIASDDSLNEFIVDSSQEQSEEQSEEEKSDEEEPIDESSRSTTDEELDTDDLVSDDESPYVREKSEIFDDNL